MLKYCLLLQNLNSNIKYTLLDLIKYMDLKLDNIKTLYVILNVLLKIVTPTNPRGYDFEKVPNFKQSK